MWMIKAQNYDEGHSDSQKRSQIDAHAKARNFQRPSARPERPKHQLSIEILITQPQHQVREKATNLRQSSDSKRNQIAHQIQLQPSERLRLEN